MAKPKRPELPPNCGQVRLFIDTDGNVSGDLAWEFDPDTPEEFVLAMQDYIHGLMSMILTDPEHVAELGRSYTAGLDTKYIDEDAEDDADAEEYEISFEDPRVTPINPSNRKH